VRMFILTKGSGQNKPRIVFNLVFSKFHKWFGVIIVQYCCFIERVRRLFHKIWQLCVEWLIWVIWWWWENKSSIVKTLEILSDHWNIIIGLVTICVELCLIYFMGILDHEPWLPPATKIKQPNGVWNITFDSQNSLHGCNAWFFQDIENDAKPLCNNPHIFIIHPLHVLSF